MSARSARWAVDLIRRVKSRGIAVTASVCPHNLCTATKNAFV